MTWSEKVSNVTFCLQRSEPVLLHVVLCCLFPHRFFSWVWFSVVCTSGVAVLCCVVSYVAVLCCTDHELFIFTPEMNATHSASSGGLFSARKTQFTRIMKMTTNSKNLSIS